jgi:hypothetical protein
LSWSSSSCLLARRIRKFVQYHNPNLKPGPASTLRSQVKTLCEPIVRRNWPTIIGHATAMTRNYQGKGWFFENVILTARRVRDGEPLP